jgi:predicted AAA+ superfamily ATPase
MFKRLLESDDLEKRTCFLWGPRQTGKSTLLRSLFPGAIYYNLLRSEEYARLNQQPSLIRSEVLASVNRSGPVIVDEVQKIPPLLDEIHSLISEYDVRFILSGSSPRKLKRAGGNLLGGRAVRYQLFPLTSREIPSFDLGRALNHGLLPTHYLSDDPRPLIDAYVGDYLEEEIAAEAQARRVPTFSRFLHAAAFSNGSTVNVRNVALECGVSAPTAREYFQILEDTLLARFIPVYRTRPKRRVALSPTFYLFDVGLTNVLLKRGAVSPGSESFGRAFEHFIFQEIVAHSAYTRGHPPVATWRTSSQLEVDFILGEHETAVECKAVSLGLPGHTKGLRAFREEYPVKNSIVVTMDPRPRTEDGVRFLPWSVFLDELWDGLLTRG